jgi:hypothetical protein
MIDDRRLTVLKRLTAHLESEVSVENGYQHDLEGAVFRGILDFSDNDELPSVSILENLNPDRFPRRVGDNDGVDGGVSHEKWILLVQGWAVDDKENPTDPAYPLMADVKKALSLINKGPHPQTGVPGHANYQLGGLIGGIEMEPGTVRPPDSNSTKAYFYMRIIVRMHENPRDPYDLS